MNKYLFFTVVICAVFLTDCKKESVINPVEPANTQFTAVGNALAIYNSTIVTDGTTNTSGYGVYQKTGSIWHNLGSISTNGSIAALTLYNGNLIAAGSFSSIGGVSANSIAMWDGSTWHPLGKGFNNIVNSLIVYNGNLIAGGLFDTTSKGIANKIAQWNGITWLPMADSGMQVWSQGIFALSLYNGNLIAGGSFSFFGKSDSANNIASFNGSSWSKMGLSRELNGVRVLTVYNGNLIAGGAFVDVIGSDSAKYIAQWNGANWTALGTSKIGAVAYTYNPAVSTITNYNNTLIIGGSFSYIGPSFVYGLAQWNGSSWSSPFGAIENYYTTETNPGSPYLTNGPDIISSSIVYNGNLIIGGAFNGINGTSIYGIAQWNGSTWSAL